MAPFCYTNQNLSGCFEASVGTDAHIGPYLSKTNRKSLISA